MSLNLPFDIATASARCFAHFDVYIKVTTRNARIAEYHSLECSLVRPVSQAVSQQLFFRLHLAFGAPQSDGLTVLGIHS